MTIVLYSICWNEEAMLGFFFRHYDPLVDRYVIYDDGSTDGTLSMLIRHPKVEIRRFERVVANSYVASAQHLHNNAWKESRGAADWIIISAIDEHLYHRDLASYLVICSALGVTLVPAVGYQMLSREFPHPDEHLATTQKLGAPFRKMSKLCIFNPDAIEETNFDPGRHRARPSGRVRYPERDEVLNLHFKYLGFDYVKSRSRLLDTGLGALDRERGWGRKYAQSDAEIEQHFETLGKQAVDLASPDRDSAYDDVPRKWWR